MKTTLVVVLGAALLSACGGSDPLSGGSTDGGFHTTNPVMEARDGTVYRQEVAVESTGDTMVIQVFEPKRLEPGQTYPLVLHGHGYAGTRMKTADAFAQRLIDNGYYLISIDQRGFGESSGQARVMSPDFEGVNLVGVLDWAENLEGLRRHNDDGRMVVGSYGGSYGGMYQYLLAGTDPQQRLRVIAPESAPHDLSYSLHPNGVVKSGWASLLMVLGEAGGAIGGLTGLPNSGLAALINLLPSQDPAVIEIVMQGILTNRFSESGINFLKYHSPSYFCEGMPAGEQNFTFGFPDPRSVPPRHFPKMDALITQGFRDTLFNFNEAFKNYECLKAQGGDVRLMTHQSGHILPVGLSTIPSPPGMNLEQALDPFYAALNIPNFQGGEAVSTSCGPIDFLELQFAWFEEKLQGKRGAVDAVMTGDTDVCLSLADQDAIAVEDVKVGGRPFQLDATTPQLNGPLGILGTVLGENAREALLATQPLYTVPAGGKIIAGIPTMSIELTGAAEGEGEICEAPAGFEQCDPILFVGIGHRKSGETRWDLIDDQLTPVRGFGGHDTVMTGIAERLAEGDQLALLVYGFHLQYPISWSRDLLLPVVRLSGSIQLPLLTDSGVLLQHR